MTVGQHFGRNLARLRKAADLSQEALGVRASLHRTEVGKLERGIRVARVDTVLKLAGALQVEPAALLDGLSWEPGETRPGRFEARGRQVRSGHG